MDLTVDHHNDNEQHFLPKSHLAIDSFEAITIAIVAGRRLDRMIQAAHLTGDASSCRPPWIAIAIDAAYCRPMPAAAPLAYHDSA
ncbi:hypothetical protein ACLOJK_023182 [Asimina triloba]